MASRKADSGRPSGKSGAAEAETLLAYNFKGIPTLTGVS
jgi:hypothetical protein